MEENLPDLAAINVCTNPELGRSNSNSNSSYLTVENSRDSRLDYCTVWTNEKHNMYLDHLESSFVEHLHRSMGLLAWCSVNKTKGPCLSRKLPANSRSTSEQLKVVQDGCLQKIDRSRPMLNSAADSILVLKSHFRCAGKRGIEASAHLQEYNTLPSRGARLRGKRIFTNGLATSSDQIPASHEDSVDYIRAEYSDQNFVEEAGEEKSSTSMSKRSKSVVSESDASSQDQIVPMRKVHMKEISPLSHASSWREEEAHQESKWESNINTFSRES